jgi:hypothetical protein
MGLAIDCLFIRDCPGRKVRIGSTHRLPNGWVHGRVVRVDNNPKAFSELARRRLLWVKRSLPVKRSLRCPTCRRAANRRPYKFPDRSAGSWLEEARQSSMASLASPSSPLTRFALGLAEAINHAFGKSPGGSGPSHPPGGCTALPRPAAAPLPLSSASAPIPRPSKLR